MQLSTDTQKHMNQYETVERRNLAYFIEAIKRKHDVVDYRITRNNEKTRYDAWMILRRPNGKHEKIMLEAKIRKGYSTDSFENTVLTKTKYWGLRMCHKQLTCDKTWHLAFYQDGLFIYDLTPEILDEKELVEVVINTKAVHSDHSGKQRPEPKFQMLHLGPESKIIKGFPIQN